MFIVVYANTPPLTHPKGERADTLDRLQHIGRADRRGFVCAASQAAAQHAVSVFEAHGWWAQVYPMRPADEVF